jgi:hypothetical protein
MCLSLIIVTTVHRHDTSVECRVAEIDERAEVPIQKNLNSPTLRGFDIASLFRLKNFIKMPKLRVWGKPPQPAGTSVRRSDPVSVMPSPHRLLEPPVLTGDSMQRSASMAALLFSSLTCPNAQTARDATHLLPAGKGWGKAVPTEPAPPAINSPKPATNGIYYHAGPILPGTAKLYFIWYGNFVTRLGGKLYSP